MTARRISAATSISELISDQEFDALRTLVYDRFGITLSDSKKTLVVGRLHKVLRQRGFDSFQSYYQWLIGEPTGEGMEELANRISTNHTFFWRENSHFEYFQKQVLPEIAARKASSADKKIRIWCAGCSSGEEPYTLVILMKRFFGAQMATYSPMLLATDISQTALETAIAGVYDEDRISALPPALRNSYFFRNSDRSYTVADDIKQHVMFRRHNLITSHFNFKNPFDAVFCRNVMIYFDHPTRSKLVKSYHRCTVPGGYLFVGHSETLDRRDSPYEYVMPAVYRRVV